MHWDLSLHKRTQHFMFRNKNSKLHGIWHSKDRALWYILIIKANKMHYFSALFGNELYMFQTDFLSINRSLNAVFTAIGICHTNTYGCEYSVKIPDDGRQICPKHVEFFTK